MTSGKKNVPRVQATASEVLRYLNNGVVMFAGLSQRRNQLEFIYKHWAHREEWGRYYPSTITREITRLYRKGYVEIKETDEGTIVVLTENGRLRRLHFDIDVISIPTQNPWDGKWRMVFFDIPSTYDERMRRRFRSILKAMGFVQMQKSVYVHPYPCHDQMQYVREVLNISHNVKLAVVETLENDEDFRAMFFL